MTTPTPHRSPRRLRPDGRIARVIHRISSTRLFSRVAPLVVPRIDRLVFRLTGGRRTLTDALTTGILLTAIGARSGEPRTTPLAAFPLDDRLYLVGSNYGRQQHPAWTANLRAHPEARIVLDGQDQEVRAHLLTAEEKAEVWPRLLQSWPNFAIYARRSGRDLRVFRLDPR